MGTAGQAKRRSSWAQTTVILALAALLLGEHKDVRRHDSRNNRKTRLVPELGECCLGPPPCQAFPWLSSEKRACHAAGQSRMEGL